MMNAFQISTERLRPLVVVKGWDYCVLWKLRDDQVCIEWMGCCCGGAEKSILKGEEKHLFPVSPMVPCRDVMFQHLRTKACDLLAQLPSSMHLGSGIHTQALISSHTKWIHLPNISDETVGTRVLIPVPGGLVELFVAKNVQEEEHITEFVMAQCNPSWQQEAMVVRNGNGGGNAAFNGLRLYDGFIDHGSEPFPSTRCESKSDTNHFQPWISPISDNSSFPWDLSIDQMRLCNSSLNFFSGMPLPPPDDRPKNGIFLEESPPDTIQRPPSFNSAMDDRFSGKAALQQSIAIAVPNLHPSHAESSVTKELGHDKGSVKQEMGRGDSISHCSDQMEDDDGHNKAGGQSGKRHQAKNLFAERRRRKKLNDRLHALRSLVPKISKMDKAAILGDAIEFVKDLQKQVKDLQDELEETPEEEEQDNCNNNDHDQLQIPNQNLAGNGDGESPSGLKTMMVGHGTRCSSSNKTGDPVKHDNDLMSADDKSQQMEVQVEVTQVGAKEFFLKIFCEQKPGGFVRLMKAINSLGLEVTNANVTTFRRLVLNVLKVEKSDNEVIQADQLKASLLELTRNPNGGGRPDSGCGGENGESDHLHHRHHRHQHQHHDQHHLDHHHHLDSRYNPHHVHHLHHQP